MVTEVDGYHTLVDSIVPWHLSNMWFKCNKLITNMDFTVSCIFREGNQCADSLPNIGLSIHGLVVWDSIGILLLIGLVCQALDLFTFEGFGVVLPHFVCSFSFYGILEVCSSLLHPLCLK